MTGVTRDAQKADLPTIDRLYRTCFIDTFGSLYAAEDLAAFLGDFTQESWAAQFSDPAYAFRIGEIDGRPAGYAKLGPLKLPAQPSGPAAELHQLYVLKSAHGSGMGQQLMDWVVESAKRRGAGELYLSVFTENHRAQRFYRRYGFEPVGPYKFMVGNHADEDVIMRLAL
jgi:ribosomal protein S18 acetylase RimI-like enzyme